MARRLLMLLLAFVGGTALADAPTPWVGDVVFARKPGQSLVWIDGPVPGSRVPTTLLYLEYRVLGEDRTHVTIRLKVNGRTAVGRIGKIDVVRLADAPAYFTKVLDATPKNEAALIQRGWAHHLLDHGPEARADLDRALDAQPRTWFLWNNRAIVRTEAGDLTGALADIAEAAKLEPTSPFPIYNRGHVYLRQKLYSDAIKEFDAALAIDPAYSTAYLDRGTAHQAQASYDLARQDYERVCRMDPAEPFGWSRRAWLLATHPDADQRHGRNAIGYAKIACELGKWKDGVCKATLGAAYAEAGKFDEAVKWQAKALEDAKYRREHGAFGRAALESYRRKQPIRLEPVTP